MNMPEKPFIYNYKRLEEPRNSRIRRPRRNLQRIVSSLPSSGATRSANLWVQGHYGPGGARRIRTDDILLAKQALYQLSYGPFAKTSLVGPTRFELVTSRLSSVRSNQLSYGPIGRSKITSIRLTMHI